jgi:hypothetical protein
MCTAAGASACIRNERIRISQQLLWRCSCCPLWSDVFIYQGTQQGIYYEVDSIAPSRRTTLEFYLSNYGDQTQYFHFLVKFFENRPNVITFQYLNVSDHGAAATVGVEMFSGMLSKLRC